MPVPSTSPSPSGMNDEDTRSSEAPATPSQVKFEFIKANGYRVVYADGVHGGITPRGQIQLNFYTERFPIPQQTVHELDAQGRIGPERTELRNTKEGIIREFEEGVIMNMETARSVAEWLRSKVEEFDRHLNQASED